MLILPTKVLPPGKKRGFRLDSGNPGNERENDREKTAFFGVVKPGIREFFPIPGADVCLVASPPLRCRLMVVVVECLASQKVRFRFATSAFIF